MQNRAVFSTNFFFHRTMGPGPVPLQVSGHHPPRLHLTGSFPGHSSDVPRAASVMIASSGGNPRLARPLLIVDSSWDPPLVRRPLLGRDRAVPVLLQWSAGSAVARPGAQGLLGPPSGVGFWAWSSGYTELPRSPPSSSLSPLASSPMPHHVGALRKRAFIRRRSCSGCLPWSPPCNCAGGAS